MPEEAQAPQEPPDPDNTGLVMNVTLDKKVSVRSRLERTGCRTKQRTCLARFDIVCHQRERRFSATHSFGIPPRSIRRLLPMPPPSFAAPPIEAPAFPITLPVTLSRSETKMRSRVLHAPAAAAAQLHLQAF